MSKKTDDELERLISRRDLLEAKIRQREAIKAKRDRAEDTRRKILIGAMVISDSFSKDERAMIMNKLDCYLTSDRDRVLFGFVPIPKDAAIDSEKNDD